MLRTLFLPSLVLPAAALLAAGLLLGGCTPHIGDHCQLNTDCSIDGTRVCDNSQPNGYCTTFNCTPDSCLDNAVCVMVYANVPGCPYNDYQAPSRTHTTLCLKSCNQDSDCRTSEGYVCRNPSQAPYNAQIIDDNTNQKVCLAEPLFESASDAMSTVPGEDAAVCQPYGPEFDSGPPDAATDSPPDAQPDVAGGG
jgi:hypothetical protein